MHKLLECIKANTTQASRRAIEHSVLNMVCDIDSPIPLSQDNLIDALTINGEFLVLKLHYDDFEQEIKDEKIKYKISQALSVITIYQDDGYQESKIIDFLKYISDNSDRKQNSTFGIKNVKKLSKFPITILFSGILPINQLDMSVGRKIYELINSNDNYFKPRFEQHRDDISKEINIPILPVLPYLDDTLDESQVRLVDLCDGRVIAEFNVSEELNTKTVDIYLEKLFFIYKTLSEAKICYNKGK